LDGLTFYLEEFRKLLGMTFYWSEPLPLDTFTEKIRLVV